MLRQVHLHYGCAVQEQQLHSPAGAETGKFSLANLH